MLLNSIRGFFMAIADSIPGISGGTIAYLLGFYDLFIGSISDFIHGNKEKRSKAFIFIIQLGFGWVIGLFLSVSLLTTLFTNHIYFMCSLLIGLTAFSIPAILKEEKNKFNIKPYGTVKNLIFFLIGFVSVLLITIYSPTTSSSTTTLASLNLKLALFLFIAGDIAISTMVLPGISGSSLLMIFGLYLPIITALKAFFSFDFSAVPALFCFGFGVLFGLITTIRIVKKALEDHRSSTISLILGLVIAAIYAISKGPTTLEIPQAPLSLATFSIVAFIIGGIPIFFINYLKIKKDKLKLK
jgi:putative membrane protein